jgi:translation initiation factor 1
MSDENSRLVFTTDNGRIKQSVDKEIKTGDGIIRIRLETKGRKGKGVTSLQGFLEPDEKLKIIAKKLKQKCSTGGTIKNSTIEIQGDHRDLIQRELQVMGYTIKFSGG